MSWASRRCIRAWSARKSSRGTVASPNDSACGRSNSHELASPRVAHGAHGWTLSHLVFLFLLFAHISQPDSMNGVTLTDQARHVRYGRELGLAIFERTLHTLTRSLLIFLSPSIGTLNSSSDESYDRERTSDIAVVWMQGSTAVGVGHITRIAC